MLTFVSIVVIVFAILQIILFFKVWGMTDDVRKLVNHFCSENAVIEHSSYQEQPTTQRDYDKHLDNVKKGDFVIRLSDGAKMEVDTVSNDRFFCKANSVEGWKWYTKYEVRTE